MSNMTFTIHFRTFYETANFATLAKEFWILDFRFSIANGAAPSPAWSVLPNAGLSAYDRDVPYPNLA